MSRLIDSNLIQYEPMLSPKGNGQYEEVLVAYKSQIDDLPTIDPERKKGKWIKKDCDLLYCSECDLPSLHPWPYCERCGAKMEV